MEGLFATGDAAMLLIDHQVGTVKLAVSTLCGELLRNTRGLARNAGDAGLPLVHTSSQEDRFQGSLFDEPQAIAPDAHAARGKRPGVVDRWMCEPFEAAVLATGRETLVTAGPTNDV